MTAQRIHLALVAIIVLLFASLLGGAYGINNLLGSESNKLVALKAKDLALTQQQVSLKKAKQDIQTYDKLDKIARSAVPEDKSQAEAVQEIVNIAASNEVSLAAITFPASTLGAGVVGSSSTGASPSPSPVASNPKAGALSQLQPVKNIPGVYQLLITVNSDSNRPVQYAKFVSFLSDLEHNRRTAQVATIALSPDSKDPQYLTFSLTLSEYIKP